jgi:hypothetical protein
MGRSTFGVLCKPRRLVSTVFITAAQPSSRCRARCGLEETAPVQSGKSTHFMFCIRGFSSFPSASCSDRSCGGPRIRQCGRFDLLSRLTSSSMLQMWSDNPVSIAGVTLRVRWTQQELQYMKKRESAKARFPTFVGKAFVIVRIDTSNLTTPCGAQLFDTALPSW